MGRFFATSAKTVQKSKKAHIHVYDSTAVSQSAAK
jgi:hypothetical protein